MKPSTMASRTIVVLGEASEGDETTSNPTVASSRVSFIPRRNMSVASFSTA